MITGFHEIVYACTEQSLVTGRSGYGIRTLSQELPPDEALQILNQCPFAYSLEHRHGITLQQAKENSDAPLQYPLIYFCKKVELSGGHAKYVAGRLTYIGINYGFYSPEGDNRTGSNAVCHIVVFNEKPTLALVNRMIQNGFFIPKDYSCKPDNAELIELLTGQPDYMPPRQMNFTNAVPGLDSIDGSLLADCAIGLLQARINQGRAHHCFSQMLFIIHPEQTESLIQHLAFLPTRLTNDFTFQTSYEGSGNIPEGLKAVFVDNEDEARKMYDINHVTIDKVHDRTVNIGKRKLFEVIRKLITQEQVSKSFELIDFFLNQDLDSYLLRYDDDDFLCQIFMMKNDETIETNDIPLSVNFFHNLKDTPISGIDEEGLWSHILHQFHLQITNSMKWSSLMETMELMEMAETFFGRPIHQDEKIKSFLEQHLLGEHCSTYLLSENESLDRIKQMMVLCEAIHQQPSEPFQKDLSDKSIWRRMDSVAWKNFVETSMESAVDLYNEKIPQKLNVQIMSMSTKWIECSPFFIQELFSRWLKDKPTISDIKEFSSNNPNLVSPLMDALVKQLWEWASICSAKQRMDYLGALVADSSWSKRDIKHFLRDCKDEKLVECLSQVNGASKPWIKIWGKMFAIFGIRCKS